MNLNSSNILLWFSHISKLRLTTSWVQFSPHNKLYIHVCIYKQKTSQHLNIPIYTYFLHNIKIHKIVQMNYYMYIYKTAKQNYFDLAYKLTIFSRFSDWTSQVSSNSYKSDTMWFFMSIQRQKATMMCAKNLDENSRSRQWKVQEQRQQICIHIFRSWLAKYRQMQMMLCSTDCINSWLISSSLIDGSTVLGTFSRWQ